MVGRLLSANAAVGEMQALQNICHQQHVLLLCVAYILGKAGIFLSQVC